jgi:hypothetical protein
MSCPHQVAFLKAPMSSSFKPLRVLVACEYSARVRDAFRRRGHEAWSCDLRPCEGDPSYHLQGDALQHLQPGRWDLLIGHPYCTFNNLAGIRWMYHPEDTHLPAEQRRRHPNFPSRMDDFLEGVAFFKALWNAPVPLIALENSQPHGLAMQHLGRYDQIVQPWMFGDPYTKAAALWLKGLPKLVATHKRSDYAEIKDACHKTPPGPDREKERSRTHLCVADAMAGQWSAFAMTDHIDLTEPPSGQTSPTCTVLPEPVSVCSIADAGDLA